MYFCLISGSSCFPNSAKVNILIMECVVLKHSKVALGNLCVRRQSPCWSTSFFLRNEFIEQGQN